MITREEYDRMLSMASAMGRAARKSMIELAKTVTKDKKKLAKLCKCNPIVVR